MTVTGVASSLLIGSIAFAQSALPPAAATAPPRDTATATQRDPSLTSALRGATPMLSLLASSDTKEASVQAGGTTYSSESNTAAIALGLTAPFDASQSTTTELADLNGLRGNARATAGLTWTHWGPHFVDPVRALEICRSAGVTSCMRSKLPAAARRQWDRNLSLGHPVVFTLQTEAGQREFDYTDARTGVAASVHRLSRSVAADLGVYRGATAVIAVGYRQERSFKSADHTQLCTPAGPPNVLRCDAGALGAPTVESKRIASVEWRYTGAGNFVVSPILRYDFARRISAVEVPIWIIQSVTGGLSGGVRLGYTSNQHQITAIGFVGGVE